MKVVGLRIRTRWPPIRPWRVQPAKAFFGGSKPCTSAMASTAMNPTLCRCIAYCAPGLPRPTQICTGSNSPQSSIAAASCGWPGTSTGLEPKRWPSQRSMKPEALGSLAFAFAFSFVLADQRHFVRSQLFGSFGSRRGLGRLRLDSGRRDDGGDGEVAVGDRRLRPLGQGDLADMDRIADVGA